jgi:type IV secretory pathway VirB10-like protein
MNIFNLRLRHIYNEVKVVSEKKPKPKTKPTVKEVKEEIKKEPPKEAKKEEITPPPKEPPKEKPKTKEAKPPTAKRPKITATTWEKFEKFTPKSKKEKKSWIKEVIKKAQQEPVEVRGLTKGQILAILVQAYRYNLHNYPKLDVKYDMKKGIALIAPIKTKTEV